VKVTAAVLPAQTVGVADKLAVGVSKTLMVIVPEAVQPFAE
jgi:hypothetical protein